MNTAMTAPHALPSPAERAARWGDRNRATRQAVADRAREAWALRLELLASGWTGDFSTWLSEHSGEDRTSCFRAWKMGEFFASGGSPDASQGDALDGLRALNNGVSVEDVNAAIEKTKTKPRATRDLANLSDFGHVAQRMTEDAAVLLERSRERLGGLGLGGLTPMERDKFIYALVLETPEAALRRVVDLYRATTENTDPTRELFKPGEVEA